MVISLSAIVYQDFKLRKIHVILPVLVFSSGLALVMQKGTFIAEELFFSIGFIVLNFVVLTLYFSLKNKALLNPFRSYIGLGDLLYLLAVAPLFMFRAYIVYFVLGMILSLILYALFKRIYSSSKTIPLAGYMSLFLIILFISDIAFNSKFLSIPIF